MGSSAPLATSAMSASSSRPDSAIADSKVLQMPGWNPHRLTDAGTLPSSSGGTRPSSETKRSPPCWRATLRRSVSPTSKPSSSTSQMPRVTGSSVATVEASS